MAQGTIVVDQERCKGCNLCVIFCPQGVIQLAKDDLNSKGYHPATLVESEKSCTGCAVCTIVCPDVCITVLREPLQKKQPSVRGA